MSVRVYECSQNAVPAAGICTYDLRSAALLRKVRKSSSAGIGGAAAHDIEIILVTETVLIICDAVEIGVNMILLFPVTSRHHIFIRESHLSVLREESENVDQAGR